MGKQFIHNMLYNGQIGTQSTFSKVKDLTFWWSKRQDIRNYITGNKYSTQQATNSTNKTTNYAFRFPNHSLKIILLNQLLSRFFVVDELSGKTITQIIMKIKPVFACHNLPIEPVRDNSPMFHTK